MGKIEKIILSVLIVCTAIAFFPHVFAPESIVKREPFFPIVITALRFLGLWFSIRISIIMAEKMSKAGKKKGAFFAKYIGWAIIYILCIVIASELEGRNFLNEKKFLEFCCFVGVLDFLILEISN